MIKSKPEEKRRNLDRVAVSAFGTPDKSARNQLPSQRVAFLAQLEKTDRVAWLKAKVRFAKSDHYKDLCKRSHEEAVARFNRGEYAVQNSG